MGEPCGRVARRRQSPPAAIPADAPVCHVPLDALQPADREHVRAVVERPTLTTRPSEVFTCRPEHYHWLLDHPDQAVRLWHMMGVKCADIVDRGGYFTWDDGKGNGLHWREVYRGSERRVFYAEGRIDPGFLLPTAAVQAVVVVQHTEGTDTAGRQAVRQRIELALHTDSHAVATAARLIGGIGPAPGTAIRRSDADFLGALAWYLNQHPRHAEMLFEQLRRPAATDRPLTLPAE